MLTKEKIDNFIESLNLRLEKENFTIEEYIEDYADLYKSKDQILKLQSLSISEYENLFKSLIEKYYENKFNLGVIFDNFYFFNSEDVYPLFYDFLENLKSKKFEEEIKAIQSFISEIYCITFNKGKYFNTFANRISHIRCLMTEFYNYYDLGENFKKFKFDKVYFFDGDTKEIKNKFSDYIFEDRPLDVKMPLLYSRKLNYITRAAFSISREVIYKEKNYNYFFEKLLAKLKEVNQKVLNSLINRKYFPPALFRITSLMPAYHNIRIKYALDNKGKNNIEDLIEDYFEDFKILNEHLLSELSIPTLPRYVEILIDIINYFNFINKPRHEEIFPYYQNAFHVFSKRLSLTSLIEEFNQYNMCKIVNNLFKCEYANLFAGYAMLAPGKLVEPTKNLAEASVQYLERVMLRRFITKKEKLPFSFYPEQAWY